MATAWPMPQLPERVRETVTAGLRWQPLTWPMAKADTMMPAGGRGGSKSR